MAFGLKGSSFALLRLNLGPKAVLSAALLIAVNTVLVVGAGYWSLTRDFDSPREARYRRQSPNSQPCIRRDLPWREDRNSRRRR